MVERFKRWLEYEKDSHEKVLRSLQTVPDHKQSEIPFQKAVDLFAHLVAARRLWLFRLDVFDTAPDDLFPANVRLESLESAVSGTHMAWSDYLDSLSEAELERDFEYTSYEGDRCRNTIVDILTQLFGHSWYHRGQIASLLRSMDCEPAITDFVFWSRQTVTG